jgi:choline dehydrogenase
MAEYQAAKYQADYVVVGAGSAGCVVAARLSETGAKVLLLEAGPRDWHPMIHIPAGILKLLHNPLVNWNYTAQPEPSTGNRPIHWPRGRVLGGSSSINGMFYVRGNPADYDGWAQMGCRGWTYDDVLPMFRRSEHYVAGGDPEFRGQGGPLKVEDYRTILPLTHAFVAAAQQAGYPLTPDYNGKTQEGVGYAQMTRKGRFRGSTAQTFLREAKNRSNLQVLTGAAATRLLFEGKRCVGVAFRRGGAEHRAMAVREVILSGGSINSPQLLQISGVGPGEHLKSIGVEVVHDAAGIGSNLIDHYTARVTHRVKDLISINQLSRGPRLAAEAMKFATIGKGALTFGVTSATIFCRSREGLASPDLQLLFTPASYDQNRFGQLERKSGMTVAVCPTRPDSRGSIMAKSPDPFEYPAITPGYLTAESDLDIMLAGIRKVRHIFSQPALAEHSLGETLPTDTVADDADLIAFCRRGGTSLYHQVGTCRMGEDPAAVVDSRLRVRGVDGLRVVDASIMPTLTTGNTNAPSIMIGEKGAAMIREDTRG